MSAFPIRTAALSVVAAIGLSACMGPYGYGGVSVGYGNGYYSGYGYPGYGYGYGGYGYEPYWGWYDGYYYPGTGYYVYDSYRRPHRWTDAHRRYWSDRRAKAQRTGTSTNKVVIRENWADFTRDRAPTRTERTNSRPVRVERAQPVRTERSVRPVRSERSSQQQRVERASRPERVERSKARSDAQTRAAVREERAARTKDRDRGD